jgi:hypothetical protein
MENENYDGDLEDVDNDNVDGTDVDMFGDLSDASCGNISVSGDEFPKEDEKVQAQALVTTKNDDKTQSVGEGVSKNVENFRSVEATMDTESVPHADSDLGQGVCYATEVVDDDEVQLSFKHEPVPKHLAWFGEGWLHFIIPLTAPLIA